MITIVNKKSGCRKINQHGEEKSFKVYKTKPSVGRQSQGTCILKKILGIYIYLFYRFAPLGKSERLFMGF